MNTTVRSTVLLCGALICALLFSAACRPIQAPAVTESPSSTEAAVVGKAPTQTQEISTLASQTVARMEKFIESSMRYQGAPGVAVCIVKDGKVAYAKGFGVATVGTDKLVTPDSLFQLMDTGRTLVTDAVMQLVNEGKVDLDAPITSYLPYFQMKDERYKKLTVRNLLNSASGLPEPLIPYANNWINKTANYEDGALEQTVRSLRDVELTFAPGLVFRYSNYDYEILGDLIAKVSGQTFEEYMEEHVLTPLGMTHSTYLPLQADPEALVSPHMNRGKDVFVSDLQTKGREHGPSLGLWSSANDMCRWVIANLNRGELDGQRILDAASYDVIWEPKVLTGYTIPWDRFGLGWFVSTPDNRLRLSYHAEDVGFQSDLRVVPDDKLGVVVLTNLFTSNAENGDPGYGIDIANSIMSALGYY